MVVEIIRYDVGAGREDEFEKAYGEAARFLSESENCLGYEVSRCVEEPSRYIVRIEWDSVKGHMEGFRKSRDFSKFFALARPFFDAIEEMRHYEVKLDALRA